MPVGNYRGRCRGWGGGPVYQVAHRDLSAAISKVEAADLTPNLARVRAYERVVNSYHRRGAVIPLRYGCVVSQESQIIKFLEEHDPQYQVLLQELEGCVEMGLRVLLPEASLTAGSPDGPGGGREVGGGPKPVIEAPAERLGLAYLTARKAHYAAQDRWTGEYRRAADRCLARFAGLFVKSKTEAPSFHLPLLSLYFLVLRPQVAAFRQMFRRLAETESARLLLSGPWPPYNFVTGSPNLIMEMA